MLESEVFYIEYQDRESGEFHTKRVKGHRLACAIARSTAMATGRRAIVRKEPAKRWSAFIFDPADQQVFQVGGQLTKREAARLWGQWKDHKNQAVCVLWPDWAGSPKVTASR